MKEPHEMASAELNEAVAREVMELPNVRSHGSGYALWHRHSNPPRVVPNYANEISAAFEVVEKMGELNFLFDAANEFVQGGTIEWRVNFACPDINECFGRGYSRPLFEKLPRAICVAALTAKRGLEVLLAVRADGRKGDV